MLDDIKCDEELDRTKYFITPDKIKIFVRKSEAGHNALARRIIWELGLDGIYREKYEYRMPPSYFLIYLGYILVDENHVNFEWPEHFWEAPIEYTYISVGYCSKAISKEDIEFINENYNQGKNIIDDVWEHLDDNQKETAKRIMEMAKKKITPVDKGNKSR